MANPPGSFIWYELLTTDIAAAADFYETVAGIKIPREATPGPMDYRMITAPDGEQVGGAMELTQAMRDGGAFRDGSVTSMCRTSTRPRNR